MSKTANPRLWKGVFLTALRYFLSCGSPLGYFVWHELPDTYTWLGGTVIVATAITAPE